MYSTDTYTIGNLKLFLWTPGSNLELDSKFDILREQQFVSADKLRENYAREHFSTCEVLSMVEVGYLLLIYQQVLLIDLVSQWLDPLSQYH